MTYLIQVNANWRKIHLLLNLGGTTRFKCYLDHVSIETEWFFSNISFLMWNNKMKSNSICYVWSIPKLKHDWFISLYFFLFTHKKNILNFKMSLVFFFQLHHMWISLKKNLFQAFAIQFKKLIALVFQKLVFILHRPTIIEPS